MIIFLDTETTDKIDFRLPVNHPSQPHIAQLGVYLAEDDVECTHVASLNAVIKPRSWSMSPGASAINHLTDEYLASFGEELEDVLKRLLDIFTNSGNPAVLVAHNLDFDMRMLLRDLAFSDHAHKALAADTLRGPRPFCTMRSMTRFCKLPGRRPGEYKWPKLEEAFEFFFHRKPDADAAHTAMGDVLSCRDIFVEGRRRGYWR